MKRWLLSALLLAPLASAAHVVPYEVDRLEAGAVWTRYLRLGFDHILPLGLDHILFILCIFFLNRSLKAVVLQASMFTLAHSITLALAAYGVISPEAGIVEPLIALSIVLLALENIFFNKEKVRPWRLAMVFLFGLVHGMGFAGVLHELGLPRYAFASALLAFNVGVELGQLAVITAMYLLVSLPFSRYAWYRRAIVIPASAAIALVAAYWTVERIVG